MRGLVAAVAAALTLAACPVALAEPLPGYSLSAPSDGAVYPAGTTQFTFEVKLAPRLMANVELTTSPLLGQNDTLADDYKVGTPGYMGESDAFPGTYRATVVLWPWQTRSGTFYFQVSALCHFIYTECGGSGAFGGDRSYVGPVHTLRVADPVPVVPQTPLPPPYTGPSEAEDRECRSALRRQASARRTFNAKRRAFWVHRTSERKRQMMRAKRQLKSARRAFVRTC